MKNLISNNKGFTLIQLVVIIVTISIAASVGLKVLSQGNQEARKLETLRKIEEIRKAISGDPSVANQTDFGFVGDMGRLPTSLDELINDPGDGNWNGPYIDNAFEEDLSNLLVDGWNFPLEYDDSTGEIGLNEESGGSDVAIPTSQPIDTEELMYGNIHGNIRDLYANSPKKGDRRNILVWMQPIYTDSLPQIEYNKHRDIWIFHVERIWHRFHNVWNVYHAFTDKRDRHRDHWYGNWKWARRNFMASHFKRHGNFGRWKNGKWSKGDWNNGRWNYRQGRHGRDDDDHGDRDRYGIYFSNLSNYEDIEIEHIKVDWNYKSKYSKYYSRDYKRHSYGKSHKLTEIYLGNKSVWKGNGSPNKKIKIKSFKIHKNAQNIPLRFRFNNRWTSDAHMTIHFYMKDKSVYTIDYPQDRIEPGELHEDDDDHECELDHYGKGRWFDHHYKDFWRHFIYDRKWDKPFIKNKVFIHPDRNGYYAIDDIPVGTYIITAFHDRLEESQKSFVIIRPDRTTKKDFVFSKILPGYRPPDVDDPDDGGNDGGGGDDGGGDDPPDSGDMSGSLSVVGNLKINGRTDGDLRLSNQGTGIVTIDKIKLSWSGSKSYQRVKKIKVGNSTKWSGWEKSGRTLDLTNVDIAAGATDIALYFEFSTDLKNKNMNIEIFLSDGSVLTNDDVSPSEN